jgi:hypothetical protein
MSLIPVNINSLRNLLKNVAPVQARTIEPFYTNQIPLVNTLVSTSQSMNINPRTENIIVQTSTATISVNPPVIHPIIVNTPTSFIQTTNNQISVTSQGESDTIISNNLITITNIEDVTNSGYTKNNSISNLYDSISSNYWNPQVNEGNINPYFYKLNYTFTGTSEIFKFVIKNNNTFPGFTNIRLYPTTNPPDYIDITPATDTNNQYTNETIALLVDTNGNPLFNTKYMTVEFTLNPSVQPNTFYQYGQTYGVIYNNNTLGLRAGIYINTNTGASTGSPGSKLLWTTEYLLNQTTVTGTNNTDNNYLVSTDGQYRIAQNRTFYQLSNDGGITYTKKTLTTTSNMKANPSGQYVSCFKNGTPNVFYSSNDYGETFRETFPSAPYPSIAFFNLSSSGNTQCFVTNLFLQQALITYISINSGSIFNETSISITFGTSFKYIGMFIKNDTEIKLIVSQNGQFYIYYHTGPYNESWTNSAIYSSRSPDVVLTTTSLFNIEQNYNSDDSLQGQYKTALGIVPSNQLAILHTKDYDNTYSSITDHSLFTEWYDGLTYNNSCIKLSSDGTKQVIIIVFNNLTISLFSNNSGDTWTRSTYFPTNLNICSNIVATDDFSIIQACGGYYYNYNGQYRTDPISYISTDYGENWSLNSTINPASSIVSTNFFEIKSQTNKTYFQIKDLNQNQVLGVSDNGFNMAKDLRVNDSNMYVLGGTLTVGPTELSSLLNDYTLNVDGTVSARNIVLLSDERFKNVIGGVSKKQSRDNINKINVVKYKFKDRPDDDRIYTGIIAQDLNNIIDDAVDINTSKYITSNGEINVDSLYSINYSSLLGYLISAIQYNQKRINKLETLLDSI